MEDAPSATARPTTQPQPETPPASATLAEESNGQHGAAADRRRGSAAPGGSGAAGSHGGLGDAASAPNKEAMPRARGPRQWKSRPGAAASPEVGAVTVWKRAKDPRSGREYYADLSTRQTQWRRPDHGWLQAWNAASERRYYCNLQTRETRWSDPRTAAQPRQATGAASSVAAPDRGSSSTLGPARRKQDTLRHLATARRRHAAAEAGAESPSGRRAATGPLQKIASKPSRAAAAPSQRTLTLSRQPSTAPADVVHRDFGLKQAGTSGGWKHRYFVLANRRLEYFDEPGGERKGILSLHPFAYVCKSTIANGCLCLFTPHRVLYFCGETPHATQRWRKALKHVTTKEAQRPLAGVLRKRMRNTHQWKERYVILFGMSLLWFEWKGGDFKGRMSLDTAHLTRTTVDGHSLCFKLRWTTAAMKKKVVYLQAANESEFKLWQKALLRHMKYEGRHPPQDPEARRAMRRRHQERREREAAERRAEAEARRAVERQGSGPWEGGEGEEVEVEDAEEEDDDEEEGARDRYGRPALWRRLVGQTPERRACRGGARVNPLTRAGTAWESLAGGASANGLRGWRKGRESRERARLKASSAAMASRAGRLHRLARQRGHAAGSWPSSGAAPGRRQRAARVAGVARTMQARQVQVSEASVEAAGAAAPVHAAPVQAAPVQAASKRATAHVMASRDVRRASAVPMLGAVAVAVATGRVMHPSVVRQNPAGDAVRDVAKAAKATLDVSARRQLASLTTAKLAVAIRIASGENGTEDNGAAEVADELGGEALRGLAAVASRAKEVNASLGGAALAEVEGGNATGAHEEGAGDATPSLVSLALSGKLEPNAGDAAAVEAVASEATSLQEITPQVAKMARVAESHATGGTVDDALASASGSDGGGSDQEPASGTVVFVSAGGEDEDGSAWDGEEEEEEDEEEDEVEDVAVLAHRTAPPAGWGDRGKQQGGDEERGDEEEEEGEAARGEEEEEEQEVIGCEALAREAPKPVGGRGAGLQEMEKEKEEEEEEEPAGSGGAAGVADQEGQAAEATGKTHDGGAAAASRGGDGTTDEAGRGAARNGSQGSSIAPALTAPRGVKQSAALHRAAEARRSGGAAANAAKAEEPATRPNFVMPAHASAEAGEGVEAVEVSSSQREPIRGRPVDKKSLLQGVSKIQKIVLARAQNTLSASGPLSVCPADEVSELVAACDTLSYKEGDVIVTSASADASCLFFVVAGVVSVVGAASRTYHRELVRRYNGDAFGAKNVIQSRLYGAFYCTAKTNLECLRLTPAALSVLGRVVGRASVLYGVLRVMMDAASGTVGGGDDSEEEGEDLDDEEDDEAEEEES